MSEASRANKRVISASERRSKWPSTLCVDFICFLSTVQGNKGLSKYNFDHFSFEDVNLALFFAPSQPFGTLHALFS